MRADRSRREYDRKRYPRGAEDDDDIMDWYAEEHEKRLHPRKIKIYHGHGCKCWHSRRGRNLHSNGHYMRYSYRLLRRVKMAERRCSN